MEELDLPKFDPGPIHVNQFKKINKKGCGNIPKAFKNQYRHPNQHLILTIPRLKMHAKAHLYKQIIRIRTHYKTTTLKNLSTRKRSLKESGPDNY